MNAMNANQCTNDPGARKWKRVLSRLLSGPLNRFDAERFPTSDHTLPTTISQLKSRGVRIHAQLVRLPGYGGQGAFVAEYRLDDASRKLAQKLLEDAAP